MSDSSWPSSWQQKIADFGSIDYTIAAGRSLVVHFGTDNSSGDTLWFAYDTTTHFSRLEVT